MGVAIGSFGLVAWVASPLWVPIMLGVVMAVSAGRPYAALVRRFGKRRKSWAAALMTIASGLGVAVFSTTIVVLAGRELSSLVARFGEHGDSGALTWFIGGRVEHTLEQLGIDTQRATEWARSQLEAGARYATGAIAIILHKTSFAFLGLIVALMTMYYTLIERDSIERRLERMLPLDPKHTRALLHEASDVGRTAFLGTLVTAAVQGVTAGVGYAVLGVTHTVTLAVATALTSFVPIVGTFVVWLPLAGYFLLEGHPVRALLLVVWGLLAVTSLADYVIRPRLAAGGHHAHPLLTLIALLGGIEVFGLAGLIVAPIVMSVWVAAMSLYERELEGGRIDDTHF